MQILENMRGGFDVQANNADNNEFFENNSSLWLPWNPLADSSMWKPMEAAPKKYTNADNRSLLCHVTRKLLVGDERDSMSEL